jgi:Rieske Fe-S protein
VHDDTDDTTAPVGATRRALMRQAACVAGAFAAGTWPLTAVPGEVRRYARSQLVDRHGTPIKARQVTSSEPWLFNYPYAASPVFLIALDAPAPAIELVTEAKQHYAAPAGVGPARSLVAFSAICAHKLMYPTPQVSFIGLRPGQGDEPRHVIHCCGDQSRYDPAAGARVLGGPAPQPLAAVPLEWDPATDTLHAVGVQGGDMFTAFFEKYAFRLEMELGAKARAFTAATTVARPASAYSRQWQSCRA